MEDSRKMIILNILELIYVALIIVARRCKEVGLKNISFGTLNWRKLSTEPEYHYGPVES